MKRKQSEIESKDLHNVNGKLVNDNIKSFVELKDINKIYPNGIQAVYDFNIDIHHHDFIVLVGPSGCGKSTTLRMVAGLEDISSGSLYIGKVLSNFVPSKDRDISMVFQSYALYPQMSVYENIAFPLKARKYDKVRYLEYELISKQVNSIFSDIDSYVEAYKESLDKNLRFGSQAVYMATKLHVSDKTTSFLLSFKITSKEDFLAKKNAILSSLSEKIQKEREAYSKKGYHFDENSFAVLDKDNNEVHYKAKLTKEEIREKVFNAAKILDLGPYLDRKPKELSGGQMQRVALGRAIVRNAKLFLMDEPLSNLDAKLRVQMRSEIVRIHEQVGATTIYVTHDQTEAMTMATRIAVMSKGWVQQIDVPSIIYSKPSNIFVATFIGSPAMNIFDGTYEDGTITFTNGYKIKMDESYKKVHDEFYKKKIAQTKSFLDKPAVKRMHGLLLLDSYLENEKEIASLNKLSSSENESKIKELEKANSAYLSSLVQIGKELENSKDEIDINDGKMITSTIEEFQTNTDSKKKVSISSLRLPLHNIIGITSKELRILHNAETFSKDKKDKKEEVLFYNKRKGKAKKAVSSYKNIIHVKDSNLVLTNNLYSVLTELLGKYEACLNGAHKVSIGIRPEHIHLDKEYNEASKSKAFTCNSDVVELLGSELLLHANFADVDMIAKISTGTLVKPHEDVSLCVETSKVLVFDTNSGDTIADWFKE